MIDEKKENAVKQTKKKLKPIYCYPICLGELANMYEKNELSLKKTYENWTDLTKSRFIEWVLTGLPLPKIYICYEDDKYNIVGGMHCLSAIFEFMNILKNEDKNKLSKFEKINHNLPKSLEDFKNLSYQDFSVIMRCEFRNSQIDCVFLNDEAKNIYSSITRYSPFSM